MVGSGGVWFGKAVMAGFGEFWHVVARLLR